MARRGEWLAVRLGHQVPVNEVVSSRVESCQVGPVMLPSPCNGGAGVSIALFAAVCVSASKAPLAK